MNYFALLCFFLFISCTSVIEEPSKDDGRISINGTLADLVFEKGIESHSIDLNNLFLFEGTADNNVVITIDSAVNNNLLNATISNNTLLITFKKDSTGFSRIVLKASKTDSEKEIGFKISITDIVSEENIINATNLYKLASYESAKTLFEEIIALNDSRYLASAYLGLGFTELKLGDLERSFSLFEYGSTAFQSSDEYHGFKAGLSFLNFSYKKNYASAIQLGLEVLLNNSTFELELDSSIDYLDVRLNVALSQFALKEFIPCYDSIRELDSSFQMSSSDEKFIYKLDQKLQTLISEIH